MDPLVVTSLNWYFDKTLNNYNYFFNITDTEQFYRVTCRTSDFSKHTHLKKTQGASRDSDNNIKKSCMDSL